MCVLHSSLGQTDHDIISLGSYPPPASHTHFTTTFAHLKFTWSSSGRQERPCLLKRPQKSRRRRCTPSDGLCRWASTGERTLTSSSPRRVANFCKTKAELAGFFLQTPRIFVLTWQMKSFLHKMLFLTLEACLSSRWAFGRGENKECDWRLTRGASKSLGLKGKRKYKSCKLAPFQKWTQISTTQKRYRFVCFRMGLHSSLKNHLNWKLQLDANTLNLKRVKVALNFKVTQSNLSCVTIICPFEYRKLCVKIPYSHSNSFLASF